MSAPSTPHGFYPFIHILRGVAPLIVAWSHMAMLFSQTNGVNWQGASLWTEYVAEPLHIYQHGGHIGVVIFFFVSGFIITHASLSETRSEFAIKRILRIFPILAVALAITAAARWISLSLGYGEIIGTQPGGFWKYVEAFFLFDMVSAQPQLLSVTWTLVTEVAFYTMTLLLLGSTRINPERATYLMIGLWAAIEMVWAGNPAITYLHFFTLYLGLLIMGRVLYLADSGIVGWRKSIPMLLLLPTLFTMFYTNIQPGVLFGAAPEPGAAYVLASIVFVCCMTYGASRVPRVVSFFADISLSLYLLHIPVGMLAVAMTFRATGDFSSALVIGLGVTVLASYLGYRFVEVPCQRLARRITKGRRKPAQASSAS